MIHTHTLLSLAVAALLFGCVRSYAGDPPLAYADVPYSSTEGRAWPAKTVALPELKALHGVRTTPTVHYVELNPEGAVPIVFIHGLGSYLKFWRAQLDTFAARGYRVIALDMVGYGKSDKPASFPYTMEAMADVVRLVAEKAGADRPILVGHSMGGQTALSYAIRYPEALRALVLTAPAGFETFTPREKAWFRSVMSTRLIKSADEAALWGSIRANNFNRWDDGAHAWLIEERVRTAKNDDFDAYTYANVRSVHGLLDNEFVRENLTRVQAPTLIIHGDRDRLIPNPYLHGGFPRDIFEHGHRQIPGSTLITLADCGHTVQLDCPEPYNDRVLSFLNGTAGPEPTPAP